MDYKEAIAEAVKVLKEGGVILYPTDSVWGIGCDATNEKAVQKVFDIKRRSGAKSLILLASDLDMVAYYIKQIPDIAIDLVEVNDAPMTIIYPGAQHLAPNVIAEDGSVGIRIPYVEEEAAEPQMAAQSSAVAVPHLKGSAAKGAAAVQQKVKCAAATAKGPAAESKYAASKGTVTAQLKGAAFCKELVRKLHRPLVSTSANISGEPTPSCFNEISQEILSAVDYCVPKQFDDHSTGRPSQIIKLGLGGEVEIIRA